MKIRQQKGDIKLGHTINKVIVVVSGDKKETNYDKTTFKNKVNVNKTAPVTHCKEHPFPTGYGVGQSCGNFELDFVVAAFFVVILPGPGPPTINGQEAQLTDVLNDSAVISG